MSACRSCRLMPLRYFEEIQLAVSRSLSSPLFFSLRTFTLPGLFLPPVVSLWSWVVSAMPPPSQADNVLFSLVLIITARRAHPAPASRPRAAPAPS